MSGRIFRNLSGKLLSHYRQQKKIVGCGDSLFSKENEWRITNIKYDCFDGLCHIKLSHTGGMRCESLTFDIDSLVSCGFINPDKLPNLK